MAISMLKIRRPLGRLIFNMGITIPGKTVFLIETAPCAFAVLRNGWKSEYIFYVSSMIQYPTGQRTYNVSTVMYWITFASDDTDQLTMNISDQWQSCI